MSERGAWSGSCAAAVAIACAGLLGLGGCAVGPDAQPPANTAPQQWSAELARGLTASSPDLAQWWALLGDSLLDDLVRRAIGGNTDMKGAVARIREARARRAEAGGAPLPSLDANASYTRRRSGGGGSSAAASVLESDYFATGFDASWEIDLFGGLRRTIEQRQAELEASRADFGNVMVSVLAEVARNYVEVRSLQARIAIAESSARSQTDTLELVRLRRDGGLGDELEVAQAEYNLADTRARIPVLQTSLASARNRLAVLLGVGAGSLDAELAAPAPVPSAPASVAVGMPAELLRRRPDVARAEQQLVAATAAVGVATADLYPKLTLSGSIGLSSLDLASLGSSASRVFAIGPSLTWNVFDAGRIRHRIEAQSALQEQALATYEGAVLTAYEEAENALVAYVREQVRRDSLGEAVAAARLADDLARTQYQHGLVDFQRVLETERAALVFQESLAISSAAVTTDLIALYKALGGGWAPATPAPPPRLGSSRGFRQLASAGTAPRAPRGPGGTAAPRPATSWAGYSLTGVMKGPQARCHPVSRL